MQCLSLHVKTLSSGDLSRVLLLLPNLEELECNDIPTDDLQHLSRETAGLVPRLRKLVIHQPSHLSEVDMFITSRSYFRFPRILESDSDMTSGLVSALVSSPSSLHNPPCFRINSKALTGALISKAQNKASKPHTMVNPKDDGDGVMIMVSYVLDRRRLSPPGRCRFMYHDEF